MSDGSRRPARKMNGRQRRLLGNWLEANIDDIRQRKLTRQQAADEATEALEWTVHEPWIDTVREDLGLDRWRAEKTSPSDEVNEDIAMICTTLLFLLKEMPARVGSGALDLVAESHADALQFIIDARAPSVDSEPTS